MADRPDTPQASPSSGGLEPPRVSTHVPGLDEILSGGLLHGGMYLLVGGPGTGKTVLANQLCFAHARSGGRCVYVTLLTESHGRMISNLSTLRFFAHDLIGDPIWYVSGTAELRERGLAGLYMMIEGEVRRRQASMLVLDGIGLRPRLAGASEPEMRTFMNHLAALLELHQCTAVLSVLAETGEAGETAAEALMADGLLELAYNRNGMRAAREIFVRKFRGSPVLEGSHVFDIDQHGITFHPRIESRLARPVEIPASAGVRQRFGVERLDEMLRGGVLAGSATALLGATGSGKTLLGLHFLAEGARRGERGLHFGFYESPSRILEHGEGVGLPLRQLTSSSDLDLVWSVPFQSSPDALAERLLTHVQQRDIQRVFVDSIEGFIHSSVYPAAIPALLDALVNELRARGMTSLLATESEILGDRLASLDPLSAIVENAILLRYVELRSQLHRFVSIIKVRGSGFDSAIREFHIDEHGIHVADTFESAEAILSGIARTTWPAGGGRGARDEEERE